MFSRLFPSTSRPAPPATPPIPCNDLPTWPQYFDRHLRGASPPNSPDPIVVDHLRQSRPSPPAPSPSLNAKVALWQGDVTRLRVGAVVNAANSRMRAGGGICGAIHQAAGLQLEDECVAHVSAHGVVPTGQTLVTRAYDLPADFVFHTVGPRNGNWDALRSCYRTCLDKLLLHQCRTIAFCCISTGIYGFPNVEAALVALDSVREWLEEDNHADAVDVIVFCVFLALDKAIYERNMPAVFPLTDSDTVTALPSTDPMNTAATQEEAVSMSQGSLEPHTGSEEGAAETASVTDQSAEVKAPENRGNEQTVDTKAGMEEKVGVDVTEKKIVVDEGKGGEEEDKKESRVLTSPARTSE